MWRQLKAAYAAWDADDGQRMGAALAYYAVFSLPPLLLLAGAGAGLAFGRGAAQTLVAGGIQRAFGPGNSEMARSLLTTVARLQNAKPAAAGWIVMLLAGAMGVASELQASLNQIWRLPERTGRLIRTQFVSLVCVLATSLVLVGSLILSACVAALGRSVGAPLPVPGWLLHLLNMGASSAACLLIFALIYRFLPRARMDWRDVWAGAAATSVLLALGNIVLGIFIGRTGFASMYGAAGSLVAMMAWTYYCAQIVYFGAEFTRVHAESRMNEGSRRDP